MVRSFHGTLVPGYFVGAAAYEHYIRAQLLSNDGRAEEAADELRHAIASDGASSYLRTRLAEELLTLGRIDEAREEVEAALHLDPQFAEAYVDLARVKMRLGDAAGAESSLRRAIEADRQCEDAYLALVNLYRDRGQDQKVQDVWRDLVRYVPGSPLGHHALARLATARGEVRQAEAEYLRALDLDAGLQDAREELAQLYQTEGRFADAVATLEDAYERSGENKVAERLLRLQMASGRVAKARELLDRLEDEGGGIDRRLWIGWRRLDTKQPDRARALAEEVLKSSDSPGARLLAGKAFEELGLVDEALLQLAKVPLRSTQYVAAQALIGRLLRDRGRYREAADSLVKAIAAIGGGDPSGSSASDTLQDLLAQVHERAGDRELAVTLLERALARRPQSDELAFALAAALQRGGHWERAVELARGVLKRDPDSVQALNFIGYALVERGVRLDEARRVLERALALKPTSGEIADSLGWLYVKMGRLDEAERFLVRADRMEPEDPEILQHLGDLYLRKSDRTRALDAYKRSLSHNPDERVRHVVEEQLLLLETGRVGSR
jgi:tetratricopeptide (TPR) repeat protein